MSEDHGGWSKDQTSRQAQEEGKGGKAGGAPESELYLESNGKLQAKAGTRGESSGGPD